MLLALLLLLAGGCGRLSPSPGTPARKRVLPPFPVVLWVDWQGTAPHLEDGDSARRLCLDARNAGVTHLALEARTASGQWALLPEGEFASRHAILKAAARDTGLSLAAVLPSFMAAGEAEPAGAPLRALWEEEGWKLVPFGEGFESRTSPASATARARELQALRALRDDPALEFIILAGFGYEDALADFSPEARQGFERWRGGSVRDWPRSVLGDHPPSAPFGREGRGVHWDSWVTWRGELLRDLLVRMRAELSTDPTPPRLLALVDAPYPVHQRLGLNWASPGTPAEREHAWLPSAYGRQTASGHLLDAVILAHWHPGLLGTGQTEEQGFAWWASVEGSMALAHRYRGREHPAPWLAVVLEENNGWEETVGRAPTLGGGLLLISASRFLENPGLWSTLAETLRTGPGS